MLPLQTDARKCTRHASPRKIIAYRLSPGEQFCCDRAPEHTIIHIQAGNGGWVALIEGVRPMLGRLPDFIEPIDRDAPGKRVSTCSRGHACLSDDFHGDSFDEDFYLSQMQFHRCHTCMMISATKHRVLPARACPASSLYCTFIQYIRLAALPPHKKTGDLRR